MLIFFLATEDRREKKRTAEKRIFLSGPQLFLCGPLWPIFL